MFYDSDGEPLSGDDDKVERRAKNKRRRAPTTRARERDTKKSRETDPPAAEEIHDDDDGRGRRKPYFRGYGNTYPVIVVDYDLTLVDRSSRPFSGAHAFIERLRQYNDGRVQLILYSHGSPAYIDDGLNKHFERERGYFDEVICDSSARENKPITHVRRVIKKLEHLVGPYVIIDDMRSNLDGDQYDVVIDVTRMTNYDQNGRAVSVDYDSCLCVVDRGIRTFLGTKKKSPSFRV